MANANRLSKRKDLTCRDADGNAYTLKHWVEIVPVPTRGNAHATVYGLSVLKWRVDGDVCGLGKGHYRIDLGNFTNVEVTCDDPDAP